MTLPKRITYAEYRNLPGDDRYELVEGELLLTPAPSYRHQRILGKLHLRLGTFLEAQRLVPVVPLTIPSCNRISTTSAESGGPSSIPMGGPTAPLTSWVRSSPPLPPVEIWS